MRRPAAGAVLAAAAVLAPAGVAGAAPSPARLARALLPASALPAGWGPIAPPPAAARLCGVAPLAGGTGSAAVAYGRVEPAATLRDGVTAYPPGDARRALDALRRAARRCPPAAATAIDPTTGRRERIRTRVSPLRLPRLRADRLGLLVVVTAPGGARQVTRYGVIRRGDLIGALTLTAAAPDPGLFARLLTAADRRLARVAG